MTGKPLNSDGGEGRDWLFVQTGTSRTDLGVLLDFLRGNPTITGKAARAAIVGTLLNSLDATPTGRTVIAGLFASAQWPQEWVGTPAWTVEFRRADGGHSKAWQN